VKSTKRRLIQALLVLGSLALVLQAFLWPRFEGIKVFDSEKEFDPEHEIVSYWDDDLDCEVQMSWSRRDVIEAFLIQAAAWEALETDDKRGDIFVNSAREACAS